MKRLSIIYAFALLGSIVACDDDDNNNSNELHESDERFVEKAALSNMTEVSFGNMAVTKAENDRVRQYGENMVAEHTSAQQELRSLGDRFSNVDWPSTMDAEHLAIQQQLMGLSGRAFDSAYMRSQVMDHRMTRDIFDNALDSGKHIDVRNYASKYRPHIEEHRVEADTLYSQVLAEDDGN